MRCGSAAGGGNGAAATVECLTDYRVAQQGECEGICSNESRRKEDKVESNGGGRAMRLWNKDWSQWWRVER